MTTAIQLAARATFARRIRRAIPGSVVVSFTWIVIVVMTAIAGQWFAPYPSSQQDLYNMAATPSATHLLGTDVLGRDVLSRIVAGSRTALVGPFVVAVFGAIVSAVLGILAAYRGGAIDTVIMRIVDFTFALPGLLISIVVVSLLGGGYWMAIVVLSFLNVQGDIRIVRGAALGERGLAYVEAARVVGVPRWRIMYRHVLPNISPILVTNFAVDFAGALVALSGLAFLGLGSEIGSPEWGSMISENQSALFTNPTASLAPSIAVVLVAVSVNLIGDWLYERGSAR